MPFAAGRTLWEQLNSNKETKEEEMKAKNNPFGACGLGEAAAPESQKRGGVRFPCWSGRTGA